MSQNKLDKVVETCSYLLHNLPTATPALDYLNKRISPESQDKFRFGYFPSQDQLNILLSHMTKEDLIDVNLLYKENIDHDSGHDVLFSSLQHHNLILPYRDAYGKVIALVGRTLLNDEERAKLNIPKYKNTSFKKSRHLFGLYESKKSILEKGYVYVVEGQFDCIQAHNHHIKNVVALGTSNMSLEQLILLLRYTSDIRLVLDNDEAGEFGRERIIEKYGKYTSFTNLRIPRGYKDMDEFLSEIDILDSSEIELALTA
jgi:DNA primase catalytic core